MFYEKNNILRKRFFYKTFLRVNQYVKELRPSAFENLKI
jgi:hypothetical protein